MGMRIPHSEAVVRRKLGTLPENWAICGWERLDPDTTIFNGGPFRILTRGPRKGKRRWDAVTHQCAVTDAEIDAERARYEADTGNCAECGGGGQQWVGWNRDEGHRFRRCTHCGGAGKAPNPKSSP